MKPCDKCKRLHAEPQCPFCLTRRQMVIGAAAIVAAPLALKAQDPPAPAYGVARPPEPVDKALDLLDPTQEGWMEDVGLISAAKAWSSHAAKTRVTLLATHVVGKNPATKAPTIVTLVKAEKESVTIRVERQKQKPVERGLPIATGITSDAKVTDLTKETIEIDGTKFECDVKSYEMVGRTFKVWSHKELPFGFAKVSSGDETMKLVKAKDSITVKAGTYDCSLWETTTPSGTRRVWRSDKMPGLTVKSEIKSKDGDETMTVEAQSVVEGK